MSRYLTTSLIAALSLSLMGCHQSKLREDMMGDSTWETSGGDETGETAQEPPKYDEQREEEKAPTDGAPTTEQQKPASLLEQPYPRVSTGVLSRERLLPVLDEGLGRFLQNVETEPAFHQGTFLGFRILSLFPGEPAFASLDLRPGDTVTSINGKPIERPEQAAAVWEDLRTASTLIVDYLRDGRRHALRFEIVDAS